MSGRIAAWIGTSTSLILHTVAFLACFAVGALGFASWDKVFLFLTTAVSLEAIYLAILIQMTVNQQAQSLKEVEEDVDEIQEDIEEIQEDVDEIQEDIEEVQEDIEEVADLTAEETEVLARKEMLDEVSANLQRLLADIEKLKAEKKTGP